MPMLAVTILFIIVVLGTINAVFQIKKKAKDDRAGCFIVFV